MAFMARPLIRVQVCSCGLYEPADRLASAARRRCLRVPTDCRILAALARAAWRARCLVRNRGPLLRDARRPETGTRTRCARHRAPSRCAHVATGPVWDIHRASESEGHTWRERSAEDMPQPRWRSPG